MSLALAPQQDLASMQVLDTMKAQADILITSGLLAAHLNKSEKVITIMLMARELGIPNMVALREMYMAAPGKPACSARLMAALVYRDHTGKALHVVESTDERCTVRYKRADSDEHGTLTWTIQMAETAGLLRKDNWKTHPAAMLRSRAISAVCQAIFPDSVLGMYTPEDLGADVDEEGNVVTGEVVRVKSGTVGTSSSLDNNSPAGTAGCNGGTPPPADVVRTDGTGSRMGVEVLGGAASPDRPVVTEEPATLADGDFVCVCGARPVWVQRRCSDCGGPPAAVATAEPPEQPHAFQEPTEDLTALGRGWTDEEHQGFARALNAQARTVPQLLKVLGWDDLDDYARYVNGVMDTRCTPRELLGWIKRYRRDSTKIPGTREVGNCERCGMIGAQIVWWSSGAQCLDEDACDYRKDAMQQQLDRAVELQRVAAGTE